LTFWSFPMITSTPNKVVIVVTSCSELGATGRKTGFYFDEMATPYWALVDAGYDVEIASIKGGRAPWDPGSYGEDGQRPASVQRFINDAFSMAKLRESSTVGSLDAAAYRAVFLPGGHGTMWDFTDSKLAELVGHAWDNGAVVGAVCHGPAGLLHAKRADGRPLVEGLAVNSFTDAEEAAVQLADVVPFLLETELRNRGARFECTGNFLAHAVRDGRLVTGQNPRSVEHVARLMLEALAKQPRLAA
jgi:putative intracellular protease/amidase